MSESEEEMMMRNSSGRGLLVRGVAVVMACAVLAPALAASYVSNGDGDWATATIWTPNGVPGATDTVTINHAVTMTAEQSVGAITISGSGSLTPGPGVNLDVWADWVNDGTFNEGTSSVTFRDSTYMDGGGAHSFYTVNIPCFVKVPRADMTVNGVWNCAGEFRHNAGKMIFRGGPIITNEQYFFRVQIDSRTGVDVALVGDITIGDSLWVTNGTFRVDTNSLTLGGTARNCGVFVFGPGRLSVVGAGPDNRGRVAAMLTRYPYSLTIMPGATIAAKYAQFSAMDAGGVVVSSGAFIDPADNFSECAFDHGNESLGPMLKIENDQTIDSMMNVTFTAAAGSNIEKLGSTGRVTVRGGSGVYWGEDYDNDPNDLIDWAAGAVEESPEAGDPAMGAATVMRGVLLLPRDVTGLSPG
ncbi:hypothetical protein FJY71_09985, partial [candidate division WOR-3 bacterium]|nr:hypothetical protein [candidate division WOR-3 bacterium]